MVRRALRTNLYPLIPFVCASRVLRGLSNLFTLSQNVKVRMALRLLRRDALLVIVAQQLIEEIDRVRAHRCWFSAVTYLFHGLRECRPMSVSKFGSSSMRYLFKYAYNSSVPSTLAMRTN